MKKLLIILFVSLLFTNQSIANDKIESMYNKCTSYIKIVNFGLENTSTDEKINFIECKLYFKGLDDAILHQKVFADSTLEKAGQKSAKALLEHMILGSCMMDPKYKKDLLDPNLEKHLVKVFVRFVEDNPKKIKDINNIGFRPLISVIIYALKEKYPC